MRIILTKVDCFLEIKLKPGHTLAAEKAQLNMLPTYLATAINSSEDAFNSYIDDVHTEMTLRSTMDNRLMINLDR